VEVQRGEMMGHVDLFDKLQGAVVDYKTTTKKNVKYFPSKQQRWQVQVYGWLLSEEHQVKTVNLVAICRDGDEDDIRVHSEPYSEEMALEALEWLAEVKARETAPPPEKPARFCKHYCGFFGGACPSSM
jgi:RecB family exonuclease